MSVLGEPSSQPAESRRIRLKRYAALLELLDLPCVYDLKLNFWLNHRFQNSETSRIA